jgi:GT2 family glycosyltransferase
MMEASERVRPTPGTTGATPDAEGATPAPDAPRAFPRARAVGKFLFAGSEKLYVRGVTYGTFRPDADGHEYPPPAIVDRDFALMARHGFNAVRTYTAPPRWLLDLAQQHGLRLLIGLGGERSIGYVCEGRWSRKHEEAFLEAARACYGHPAVLAFAVANEIPASIVRWLGAPRVERHVERLCALVRRRDPGALVTYVSYPTTEYLRLPFLDFHCFNVYLEQRERLEAYLARLQNLVGDQPLVLAEIGLDSMRNGEDRQAETLAWQVRSSFASGAAGAFVYAWTDEWHRGGEDVHDWAFGLTRRDRSPKPALAAVERAMREVPFSPEGPWPRISVVVCSYNGSRTLRDCLEGLAKLEYPDFEVIVVDDGSKDNVSAIASEYDVRLIRTENRGLSSARNTGMEAATGEIVAYTDDDARPDPHWLYYLGDAYRRGNDAGVGGPNIVPPDDGWIAQCVAASPGGPAHVLLSDQVAEHIPGCNMSFRKRALQAIDGFDVRYRTAGDDVDLCWRLTERGLPLGFRAGAMVWHHRRGSVRTYWRQQVGYGRAEALLEGKWPERYNALGHVTWAGSIYGTGLARAWELRRSRIYQGAWGLAPFQRLYEPAASTIGSLILVPEWYLGVAWLALFALAGVLWAPLRFAIPLFALAAAAPLALAVTNAANVRFPYPARDRRERWLRRPLTAYLYAMQPLARLHGRLKHGLTPWRDRSGAGFVAPTVRSRRVWCEQGASAAARLDAIERDLRSRNVPVRRGGDFDRWDLELRGGPFAAARMRMAVEEHAGGRQLVRLRAWPRVSVAASLLAAGLGALAIVAARDSVAAAGLLGALALGLAAGLALGAGAALAACLGSMGRAQARWK